MTEPSIDELAQLMRETDPNRIRERHEQDQLRLLRRAVNLAPTLEICEALLRGEEVPLSRLDPYWVRRYGLRAAG